MTTEQKEAVETMQHWIEYAKQNKDKINKVDELIGIQETVLNLIQEQEKEIEASRQITTEMNNDVKKLIIECKKKNKIIDLMAKAFKQDDVRSVEEIKQYFEKRANEKGD